MWHPRNAEQPAAIVPCVANLVNGPSGLTHEPGTCFDERWRDHFFVCDFEGEFDNSRVVAFSVEPVGAGYRLKSEVPFVSQGIVATDCDFGPDGAMYVSDWVHGWQQPKRGRVWRITDERTRKTPLAAEARSLLQMDLARCDSATLMQRLGHADQRVRLEAQLALAQRAGQGGIDSLRTLARLSGSKLARLHAIWGLGQVARGGDVRAIAALLPLLRDRDAEVRAQVAKVLGEAAAKVPASARAPAPGGF